MKRTVILFLFVILFSSLNAIVEVTSFRKLNNDSISILLKQRKDLFSKNYSAIYLQSKIERFITYADSSLLDLFPMDSLSYCLIVPPNTRVLNFRFLKQNIDFDYHLPFQLEKNESYKLNIDERVEKLASSLESPDIQISSVPSGATVYINSKKSGLTPLSLYLKPGEYEYKLKLNGYLNEAGVVSVNDNELKQLTLKLKSNNAKLLISSTPETGALVIVDGKSSGKYTPCTLDKLSSGAHIIELKKSMYENTSKKVNVLPGETKSLSIELNPGFADVRINTEPKSAIYINEAFLANGFWMGRLKPGKYKIEAFNEHVSDSIIIKPEAGQQLNLVLRPTQLKGQLKLTSTPTQAIVKIDGKPVCQTPNVLESIRAGTYHVEFSVLGYAPYTELVRISPEKTTLIHAKLMSGRSVTITSVPTQANIFVDGVYKGKTPFKGRMLFGGHTVKVEKDGVESERLILLAPSGGETNFQVKVNSSFKSFTDTIGTALLDMVAVRGGVFQMGNDGGESAEKPSHTVSVNSFYICSTEVTQELWELVMHDNPSFFKGNKLLPVENISWEQSLQFIEKLNIRTGKKYRMPTEAEWEYAATTVPNDKVQTIWSGCNDDFGLVDYAWFDVNSRAKTHRVAAKQPNKRGLFDMCGNVSEWCSDWYDSYPNQALFNPTGSINGNYKVSRGGSWYRSSHNCRVSFRDLNSPQSKSDNIGLRLVLSQ